MRDPHHVLDHLKELVKSLRASVQVDMINGDIADSSICWIMTILTNINPEEMSKEQLTRIINMIIVHVMQDEFIGKELLQKWDKDCVWKEIKDKLPSVGHCDPLEFTLELIQKMTE